MSSCGVGYFSADYIGVQQSPPKHSYDNTVNNLIIDGITSIENIDYWEKALSGEIPANPDFVRTLFDRYHAKEG
jgi:hypothetical protein